MTSQTRPGRPVRLSRRATVGLGLGLGVAAVTGCAVNNPLTEDRTPATKAVRDLAPDVAIAVEAATALHTAAAAVATTGERHPALAAKLAGLRATHDAHLGAVVEAVPAGVDTSPTGNGAAYVVPARPARALAQLIAAELSLRDTLVGLALRAESGPFARLLGAMAAAVSQQLHGLAP
jgi:hypothetical protein